MHNDNVTMCRINSTQKMIFFSVFCSWCLTLCARRVLLSTFYYVLCTTCVPVCVCFSIVILTISMLLLLLFPCYTIFCAYNFFFFASLISFSLYCFWRNANLVFVRRKCTWTPNWPAASQIVESEMQKKSCIICVSVSVDSIAFFHANEKCKNGIKRQEQI